jgi:hypothetical protein
MKIERKRFHLFLDKSIEENKEVLRFEVLKGVSHEEDMFEME